MISSVYRTDISAVGITNILTHGFWLLLRTGQELFLPYADSPWFKDQPVSVIVNVGEQDLLVFDYTQGTKSKFLPFPSLSYQ